MQQIICNSSSMPVYKSTLVNLNDDGTYSITHVFISKECGEIKVEFPRVQITIDHAPNILSLLPPVIPFSKCEVLKDANNRLFVMSASSAPVKKNEWCDNQLVEETGSIACLAHLAEGRVQNCPYQNNEDRLSRKYPCADYKPKGGGGT